MDSATGGSGTSDSRLTEEIASLQCLFTDLLPQALVPYRNFEEIGKC